MSFYKEFCQELGITPENNIIQLKEYSWHSRTWSPIETSIFTEDKRGNVDILVYSIERKTILIDNPKARPDRPDINNARDIRMHIKRLKEPRPYIDPKTGEEQTIKYEFPKGSGSFPFFPPLLLEHYEKKIPVDTLFLTEGYKKAWYASLFGVPVVGLSSITHYKNKDTQAMYEDVISFIEKCGVKNVVMLYDGDCFDISPKALESGKDLYTRPAGFYNACCQVRELLKDSKVDVYFSCVNSDSVEGNPKGLDDIFLSKKGTEGELVEDLKSLSRPGVYFTKLNITNSCTKLAKLFGFDINVFYNTHSEKIKLNPFTYRGTQYAYDEKKQELKIVMPVEAKSYFRVGDEYYKYVEVPNKYKQYETQYYRRKKGTIKEDHGDKFLGHIAKYEAFCNVPDHINYSKVINSCFNMYYPMEYIPEDGDCKISLDFVKHIFGNQAELGLDYIQLLYQQPTQILPILCLVSKENSTGKSTFIKWMKAIFSQNATIIGNDMLSNNFNASWGSKLLVMCEETIIDKKPVVEKIKSLSTGDKIQMELKGRDATEIDFFGKFVLASNQEDSFIYANKDDIRYWVLKVPRIEKENINMTVQLLEEIPAFLYFLNSRSMSTTNESRMWFKPEKLITDALKKLREANRPRIERVIEQKLRDLFLDTGEEILYLPIKYIREFLLNAKNEDENYIRKVLEENLGVAKYKNAFGKFDCLRAKLPYLDADGGYRFDTIKCRPYVFNRDQFLTLEDFTLNTIGDNI